MESAGKLSLRIGLNWCEINDNNWLVEVLNLWLVWAFVTPSEYLVKLVQNAAVLILSFGKETWCLMENISDVGHTVYFY